MGRSPGPARSSAGIIPKRVTRSVGALRNTVIRLLNVSSASPLWAGAAAADNACETPDTVPCALPAAGPVAWLTAAAWPADAAGSVFLSGDVKGLRTVAH